jgi:hypothetical protein
MPTLPSSAKLPEGGVTTLDDLIDLAGEQISYASRRDVPLAERVRLCRAARSLLTAVIDDADDGCFRRLGAVAASVVQRISHD